MSSVDANKLFLFFLITQNKEVTLGNQNQNTAIMAHSVFI